MGEYAEYNGRQIKIGTCENMTGLTARQAPLVTKVPNSLDPIRSAESIRFRFPFPDEDGSQPGQPEDFDRSVPVPGLPVPDDAQHYSHLGNGCAGALVAVTQQKVVDGRLALVCECSGCSAAWRLPELSDAEETITALRDAATEAASTGDVDLAGFYATIAERAEDGYLNPPAWVAARAPKAPEPEEEQDPFSLFLDAEYADARPKAALTS